MKLKTGAGDFDDVAVAQLGVFAGQFAAIELGGFVVAGRQQVAVRGAGDGATVLTGFAEAGDGFDQLGTFAGGAAATQGNERGASGNRGRFFCRRRDPRRCRGGGTGDRDRFGEGSRFPGRVVHERQAVFTDGHLVFVFEVVFGNLFVVDVGAVGAAEILDEGIVADGKNICVLATDREVVQVDVAAGFAADLHVALPKFDVVDDIVIKLDDELGHRSFLGQRRVGFRQNQLPPSFFSSFCAVLRARRKRLSVRTRITEILSGPPAWLTASTNRRAAVSGLAPCAASRLSICVSVSTSLS